MNSNQNLNGDGLARGDGFVFRFSLGAAFAWTTSPQLATQWWLVDLLSRFGDSHGFATTAHVPSRGAATAGSPRRKPWVHQPRRTGQAPEGRQVFL